MRNPTNTKGRMFLLSAAVSGFTCIALGAFGAHALKSHLSVDALAIWHTAVQYQMFQTLALFGIAVLLHRQSVPELGLLNAVAYLFMLGIVFFCGSLYALALSGVAWLGAITPLGGLCFLAAWALLFFYAVRMTPMSD